jgi:hypothetical protein
MATESGLNPKVPPEHDAAIVAWMGNQGWRVARARWEIDVETGFHVWQEQDRAARVSHALWVSEPMVRHLSAEQLVEVLNREEMAQEIRISLKVRIEERGDEYRVSVVPRRSGEWPRQD